MNLSTEKIVELVNGAWLQQSSTNNPIQIFCTDSRKVRNAANSIFIPLKTSARDGHNFIETAYNKGVRNYLCSQPSLPLDKFPDANFILVEDTLAAMQTIAAHHRSQFSLPVIGITGSNGKTIIKEWLAMLLGQFKHVVKNPKSYNSQLGVALSVSQIKDTDEIGIFEAGISQPAEMEQLRKMIQPSIGLFSMIGVAHDANFANTAQKIKEKLLLFTKVEKLFFCSKHEGIKTQIQTFLLEKNPDIICKSWGVSENDTLQITKQERTNSHTIISGSYKGEQLALEIPYTDAAYIENAIHCWLILLDLGFDHQTIAPQFIELPPVQMRLELIKGIQACTLINDSYSSDLASLEIALDFLSEQKQHTKHSLILSDILQQGKSATVYKDVLQLLKDKDLHRIVLIGSDLQNQLENFKNTFGENVFHFKSTDNFLEEVDISMFQNEAILIKGARKFTLEKIVNRLEVNIHDTILNINLSALINNVNVFKKQLSDTTKIMGMVKAFSYGSGTYEVASALEHHGVDYLAVAYEDEGILLRKKGILLPILVLNPTVGNLSAMQHYNLEPEIYSISILQQFAERLKDTGEILPIHIKLDTGMHRLGVEEKDVEQFIDYYLTTNCFEIKSVFSHLVASDSEQHQEFTKQQLSAFKKMSIFIEDKIGYQVIKHISNSGGAINQPDLQLDMVRLGIGLYGINNNPVLQKELQQIGRLKTSISQIKHLTKAETVGYGRAGKLKRDSKIATIDIGYADGYSRKFGQGVGHVLIHGKLASIVGNVCMDMTMVDVTDIPNALEGSEVIVFGPELPVTELAKQIDTIPYEIIAGISQRVKRVFYKE